MPAYRAVKFGRGRKDILASYLTHELTNCLGDRGSLESKWKKNIIQWRARVIGDGTTDIPYVGAADFEVPVTDMHVQPVYADFLQSLHAPKDFWSIQAIRPDGVEAAKPLQEFLSLVEKRDLNMRGVNGRTLLDTVVHGTGIYKDHILHERKKRQDYNEAGEIEDVTTIRFQPRVDHVPLRDFFLPAYSWNIDPDDVGGAPWVAHRFRQTKGQFKVSAEGGGPMLPSYDKQASQRVEAWETDIQGDDIIESTIRSEDQYQPFRDSKITLYEMWLRFDVEGDGVESDIVVIWHHETREVLRATYVPLIHGKRPFEAAKYLPFFGFYGLGVAEADEWSQRGISRLFNSAINNGELANTVMLGIPLGANFMPDEPLYAGRQIPLGPGEKISEIRMGQPYPGMFQLINDMAQWAEQRTAVNELRQGDITGLPSRTPASTVLQLLGESNKRFDMIMSNLREGALNRIGQRTLQNIIQISKDDPRYIALAIEALGQKDGSLVAEVLQGPILDIESNYGVNVTATSSKVNKEVDKQNLISLGQYFGQSKPAQVQYAQALVQLGAAGPELLASTIQAAFNASIEMERRMTEAFDIQNPEQYSPAPIQPQEQAAPAQPGAGAPAALPAGGPQAAAPLAQAEAQIAQLLGL